MSHLYELIQPVCLREVLVKAVYIGIMSTAIFNGYNSHCCVQKPRTPNKLEEKIPPTNPIDE